MEPVSPVRRALVTLVLLALVAAAGYSAWAIVTDRAHFGAAPAAEAF